MDSLWSGGNKLLICLSARTSINSHRAPGAFCREQSNLRGQSTVPERSCSANPAAREPGWDAAGAAALPQQQTPLVTRGATARLQLPSLPAQHLERDAAATNPHHKATPGSFPRWFQQDRNSTQEKAILNYCPDGAS